MSEAPLYPVPALEKGLDILETLAAAETPQSLADLATALNRRSGELFRMLNCLERRRFLVRDAVSGKYELSLRLVALAHAHSIEEKLLRFARRPMQALAERTRQSCHLSVLDDNSLLVVAAADSPERVRLSIEIGARFDPLETASGKVLLAHREESERAELLRTSARWQAASASAREQWEEQFEHIVACGYCEAAGETVAGVNDLAMLVGRPDDGVVAALTLTALQRRNTPWNSADALAALRTTIEELNHLTGLSR